MGYCMQLREADFFVPKDQLNHLAEAVRGMLADVNEKGSGGRWVGGKIVEKWYSWVSNEELAQADTAEKAFLAWNWEVFLDDEGNINAIVFNGEKLGDDEQFFQTIAPFVKDGSYVEMGGEDGAIWRWVFENGKMMEKSAKIAWE